MTALSQEKFLQYTRELNRIYEDGSVPSKDAMLRLIRTICTEEGSSSQKHITAIGFIWQVATAALGSTLAPKPGALR